MPYMHLPIMSWKAMKYYNGCYQAAEAFDTAPSFKSKSYEQNAQTQAPRLPAMSCVL